MFQIFFGIYHSNLLISKFYRCVPYARAGVAHVFLALSLDRLCTVFLCAVHLAKTMIQSRATTLTLGQAFLSTVTMFAGLYVITYRINVSTLGKPSHALM